MNTLSFSFQPLDSDPTIIDVFPVIDGRVVEVTFLDATALLAAEDIDFVCFDLFTCSCGVAGCAGFFDPFVVTCQPDAVTWFTKGAIGTHLGGDILTFEPAAYKAALAQLRTELAERFGKGETFTLLTDVDWNSEDEEVHIRLDPTEQESRMREWFQDEERRSFARRELVQMACEE